MKKTGRIDRLIDSLYENKWLYIRYFAAAILCTVLRFGVKILFLSAVTSDTAGAELLSWIVWAVVFFPTAKLFAFRNRCEHIYSLLKQIILYIFCAAVLWFTRQLFVSVLYVLSSQSGVATGLGGMFNEILCLFLMYRVVFYQKPDA